jgi:hypothetical protein
MNRDTTIGIVMVALLLGGLFLLARRPAAVATPISTYTPRQLSGQGNIRFVPAEAESPRYRNKETRRIKYNEDNLPIEIEIIRDYAIA